MPTASSRASDASRRRPSPRIRRSSAARSARTTSRFAAPAFAAHSAQLGGTIGENDFSSTEVGTLAQAYTSRALLQVNTTQVAVTRAYQQEAVRLSAKLGSTHPKTQALAAQAEAGVVAQRLVVTSAEANAAPAVTVPDAGSAIGGRVVNTKGQGQAGFTVELLAAAGSTGFTNAAAAANPAVIPLGRSDANGHFGATFDSDETARLARLGTCSSR